MVRSLRYFQTTSLQNIVPPVRANRLLRVLRSFAPEARGGRILDSQSYLLLEEHQAKCSIIAPISRLAGEDMTLDSRPVSLDALSAEDGAAVALAVSQAASENTRRAYRQQWAAFTTWASAQGYPSLPALDATLAAYLTLLAGQGFALASVRQARGAVVKAHQLAGFPTPAGPVTAASLLGLGRSIGAAQGQAVPPSLTRPSGNDGPGRNPARRRGRGRAHLRPVGPPVAAADSGNGPGRRFGTRASADTAAGWEWPRTWRPAARSCPR